MGREWDKSQESPNNTCSPTLNWLLQDTGRHRSTASGQSSPTGSQTRCQKASAAGGEACASRLLLALEKSNAGQQGSGGRMGWGWEGCLWGAIQAVTVVSSPLSWA